ncbi:glycoside hydrolase [Chytriomyces sp. MP71]|nr:glycoside hydrolase [Chytriomyces sp. MP71]
MKHIATSLLVISVILRVEASKRFSKEWTAPINPEPVTFPSGKRSLAYHANWDTYNDYQVADLPIQVLTDVNYAFYTIGNKTAGILSEVPVSIDPYSDFQQVFNSSNEHNPKSVYPDTADQAYFGNFGQLMKLKRHHKYNLGLSVGGWNGSKYFSSAVANANQFVEGIMDVLKGFPGLFNRIDIDWEYLQNTNVDNFGPGNQASPQDPANFATFLKLLRTRLDKAGYTHFEISATVPANPAVIAPLPFKAMIKYLNFFNIMTYDFQSSAWGNTISGPQSNIYSVEPYAHFSVDLAVKTYLSYGVPAHKINIGVPMYSDINGNTTALNSTESGSGSDLYKTVCPSGQCDYNTLPWKNSTEYWDSASKATYAIDPFTKDMLTYDSVYSVLEKCYYVWDHGLAGMFAWRASQDVRDPTSKRSLMSAMHACLAKDPRV